MANAHNSVSQFVSFVQSMHVKQLHVYVIPHIHADLFHRLWPNDSGTKFVMYHDGRFYVHADLGHHLCCTVFAI